MKKTKKTFLSEARSYLGTTGRPNAFTKWYAKRHGNEYKIAAWCAMYIAYVANRTSLGAVVGEFAYTPYWVKWFKKNGRWGSTPKVGSLVFYDWDRDGVSDHVGIVEDYDKTYIYVLEGNKDDAVKRVVRYRSSAMGYGYPKYPSVKKVDEPTKTHVVLPGETLSKIARDFYGVAGDWRKIYTANKDVIGDNPSLIHPGTTLIIPQA